ncbi:MAG TPA: 2Fe-2S iron-sulfur cluster-binding protein [Hyphomicrobiaceae bacterium]|nr:2Fe-2S iron-sulfur cluster-binding protein [Hyphomicrobiaceae bacterium]
MILIKVILPDGSRREVEAEIGETIKDLALRHSLPGISGECGGVCACATCHVIVSPEWFPVVGAPPEFEDEMLMIADDRQMYSRLGCQVEVTTDMNGLELRIP